LRKFEQEAIQSKDIGRLLFTTEAEKSVGLLHLLTQKYDIIIMNPPHGPVPKVAKTYLQKHYPRSYYDYYALFIEQAVLTETIVSSPVLVGIGTCLFNSKLLSFYHKLCSSHLLTTLISK
jgi:Eco57I restriction-modification methylase